MGTKNKPGEFDCYSNAMPDEPMFILLGRDPLAPCLVQRWAQQRFNEISMGLRPESDRKMVDEAQVCALAMQVWRTANDGKWRSK